MQIHHIITTQQDRYILDPKLGPVLRREQILKPSDVTSITYANRSFQIGPDGSFNVDDDVAQFLLGRPSPAGEWHAGPSPYAPSESEETVSKTRTRPTARKV